MDTQEDEYVSIKTSNSMCIAFIADLEFASQQYPNTLLGGTQAGQDTIRLLRQHIDEQGEQYTGASTRILIAWIPPPVRRSHHTHTTPLSSLLAYIFHIRRRIFRFTHVTSKTDLPRAKTRSSWRPEERIRFRVCLYKSASSAIR